MIDMADIRGLTLAKRAIEVMVAGGFNLLLHGAPGSGKTMLARRAVGLFPLLSMEAASEVAVLHQGLGCSSDGITFQVPMRAPHHTVGAVGLLGGGSPVRPGEVSLAHHGVLFLDELPEFSRACMEGLREPLADRHVRIVRSKGEVVFPARFQLLAAMNACPCGYLGHPEKPCVCPTAAAVRYQQRISSLADCFDLAVSVEQLPTVEVGPRSESSDAIRQRIVKARDLARQRAEGGIVESIACRMTAHATRLVGETSTDGQQRRIRRVAQTIADLESADEITDLHVAEAITLRRLPEHVQ